jgi:hypothetical protein
VWLPLAVWRLDLAKIMEEAAAGSFNPGFSVKLECAGIIRRQKKMGNTAIRAASEFFYIAMGGNDT